MTAGLQGDVGRRDLAHQLLGAEVAFNMDRERHEAVRTESWRQALAEARRNLEVLEARAKWVGRGES